MAELERELQAVAMEVEWPPTPPLALRLEARRRRRVPLAVVVAAAVCVAIAVAFSVPAARSAILRFFHLGGVTVEQVAVVPPAPKRPLAAGLGRQVDEAAARAALGDPFRLPRPNAQQRLYLRQGVVSTLLATPQPVLLSEFRSGAILFKKISGMSSKVVPLAVGHGPGLWIEGEQHLVLLPAAPPRLAGNVLLWQSGPITYRLESRHLSERLALRLARAINGT